MSYFPPHRPKSLGNVSLGSKRHLSAVRSRSSLLLNRDNASNDSKAKCRQTPISHPYFRRISSTSSSITKDSPRWVHQIENRIQGRGHNQYPTCSARERLHRAIRARSVPILPIFRRHPTPSRTQSHQTSDPNHSLRDQKGTEDQPTQKAYSLRSDPKTKATANATAEQPQAK